jgi:hypothetical protein
MRSGWYNLLTQLVKSMNEERLQQYLNLIDAIINAPNGEEVEILANHTDLLDADFVQILQQMTDHLSQQGETNLAEFLQSLASQLDLMIKGQTIPLEDYLAFWQEVLQSILDTDGNREVIYPILHRNLDKINEIFVQILLDWSGQLFPTLPTEEALYLADLLAQFSLLISEFPLGHKAINFEISKTCNEIALTVFRYDISPEKWAAVHNSLGVDYSQRVFGDRAQNLPRAIASFEAALTVYNQEEFPDQWEATKNNLEMIYAQQDSTIQS